MRDDEIVPEHVMASGALPPALPMVKIGTDHFWDGGIVSNTPLQHLLDQDDGLNSLVFQVDLFSARGPLPRDIQDVLAATRTSCIPRAPATTPTSFAASTTWKRRLRGACQDSRRAADRRRTAAQDELADLPEIAILQLIYQQKAYEGHAKDHEFSGTSMREHWKSGYEDTKRTLKHRDWIPMPPKAGARGPRRASGDGKRVSKAPRGARSNKKCENNPMHSSRGVANQ